MPSIGSTAAAAGAGLTPVQKTSNYTAKAGDLVEALGAITVTLPTGAANGAVILIRKVDSSSSVVTVLSQLSIVIEGSVFYVNSVSLGSFNSSIEVYYNAADSVWRQYHTIAPLSSAGIPVLRSGYWYNNILGTGNQNVNLAAGYQWYQPVFFPVTCTLSTLGMIVSAGATTNLRLALYANSPQTAMPTTLLAATTTFSNPTTSQTVTPALSANYTVTAGWYWIAVGASAQTPIYALPGGSATPAGVDTGGTTLGGGMLLSYIATSGGTNFVSDPSGLLVQGGYAAMVAWKIA